MEIAVALLAFIVVFLLGVIASCVKDERKLNEEIDELNEKLQSSNSCLAELADRLDETERKLAQLHILRGNELRVCTEVVKERDGLKSQLCTNREYTKAITDELSMTRNKCNDLQAKFNELQSKLSRVESALKPRVNLNDTLRPTYWFNRQDFKDATFASIFGRAYANT